MKNVLIVVAILLIGGAAIYLLSSKNDSSPVSQTNSTNLVDKEETPLENIKQIESNKANIAEIPTGWTSASNKTLGIQFIHPNDWIVSELVERNSADGISVSQISVYPDDVDATRVYFFTTQTPLNDARNITLLNLNTSQSEFKEVTINGYSGIQRTDLFTNNSCTRLVTLIERAGVVYGTDTVQCPTHPEGYDQIRTEVANSLKIQ